MQKVHFSTTPMGRGRLPRKWVTGFISAEGRFGSAQLNLRAP